MEEKIESKEIKISDNRILNYTVTQGYVMFTSIKEVFLSEGHVEKSYDLGRWDDYGFKGYIHTSNYEEELSIKKLSFDFDKEHILYIPFLHLLKGEDELIIDDDNTYEENKKYMRIYKDKEKIYLDFINELDKDESFERFHIFIKNIGMDIRSKIDANDKDTKERLFFFYQEVSELFFEEYHQITTEEYLLKELNALPDSEAKKYTKKFDYKPIF